MYNQGIGEFDLDDQRTTTYHFDNKSSIRVYLHILFYLKDVTSASSFIFYNIVYANELSSTSKPSLTPTWLIVIQVKVVPYQRIKLSQKENSGVRMRPAACPPTSQIFSMIVSKTCAYRYK